MRLAMFAKVTHLIAFFFIGCLSLMSGAVPAHAHAGHAHRTTAASVKPVTVQPAAEEPLTEPVAAMVAPSEQAANAGVIDVESLERDARASPTRSHRPLHQGNCCCGSIACHAGVAAAAADVTDPYQVGERIALRPVPGMATAKPGGIERPPRGRTGA
jgi:hypothetical protein